MSSSQSFPPASQALPEEREYIHKTVLLHESIDGLAIEADDIYLDGTLGSAGHAAYALSKYPSITVIGIDQDKEALVRSQARLDAITGKGKADAAATAKSHIFLVNDSFRHMDRVIESVSAELGGATHVHRIMLDLGLSSDQFETSGRGFSFKNNEPLLMTFKKDSTSDLTARQIVNTWDEENIADIIYGYGEERYARRIAREIVSERAERPIETTFDLVEIIKKATPSHYHHGKIHPATRTFQALRITVNDEINALKDGLAKGLDQLTPAGRMAVISFHSIEDRIVKHFYKEKAATGDFTIMTKRPITPTEAELAANPRSRSAKLRIIQKNI